jgi:nitrate reductase assembly molybdenum cofactor insertion protein NarJ
MGTSRCWQDNVVNGFHQAKNRKTVAARKKTRRLAVRQMVKKLKDAGKTIDLQAVNQEVVNMFRRKRQSQKVKYAA